MLENRAVFAPPGSDGSDRPTGRDENTVDRGTVMTEFLKETSDRMDIDPDSLILEGVASNPIVGNPMSRSKVHDVMVEAHN